LAKRASELALRFIQWPIEPKGCSTGALSGANWEPLGSHLGAVWEPLAGWLVGWLDVAMPLSWYWLVANRLTIVGQSSGGEGEKTTRPLCEPLSLDGSLQVSLSLSVSVFPSLFGCLK